MEKLQGFSPGPDFPLIIPLSWDGKLKVRWARSRILFADDQGPGRAGIRITLLAGEGCKRRFPGLVGMVRDDEGPGKPWLPGVSRGIPHYIELFSLRASVSY